MAEENSSPISAPVPPAVNPLGSQVSQHAATLKLKPVIRKPVIGGLRPQPVLPAKPQPQAPSPAPAQPSNAMEQLKTVTQKLKGVTQQIPQQAILHKTGILADQNLTEAQKQASKSRTARISLSDAVGAAPVQSESAPMKTIRIKRPTDLKTAPTAPAPMAVEPAAPAVVESEASKSQDSSLTQRKTLKISRPGAVRPGGKFALKKPGAPAADSAAASAESESDKSVADIADIPDIPEELPKAVAVASAAPEVDYGVPAGLMVVDTILQFAACIAIAFLGVFLYLDLNTLWF